MNCVIRALNRRGIEKVYRLYVSRFFKEDELLQAFDIANLISRKLYRGFGLYDGGVLVAFGLFFTSAGGQVMLLDYFVTLKKYRGYGYSMDFFKGLAEYLREVKQTPYNRVCGIFIEIPGVQDLTKRELKKREALLSFYKEAGAYMSDIIPQILDKEYNVLFLPVAKVPGRDELKPLLLSVYKNILPSFSDVKKKVARLTE